MKPEIKFFFMSRGIITKRKNGLNYYIPEFMCDDGIHQYFIPIIYYNMMKTLNISYTAHQNNIRKDTRNVKHPKLNNGLQTPLSPSYNYF